MSVLMVAGPTTINSRPRKRGDYCRAPAAPFGGKIELTLRTV